MRKITYRKIVDPADKCKETMGIALKGRITFSQYAFLVQQGHDGNVIMKWTCYHAHKVISKLIERLRAQARQ